MHILEYKTFLHQEIVKLSSQNLAKVFGLLTKTEKLNR